MLCAVQYLECITSPPQKKNNPTFPLFHGIWNRRSPVPVHLVRYAYCTVHLLPFEGELFSPFLFSDTGGHLYRFVRKKLMEHALHINQRPLFFFLKKKTRFYFFIIITSIIPLRIKGGKKDSGLEREEK